MKKDPYNILIVFSDASDDQIKQAYRQLAKKYHPDMNKDNPQAAQKMSEINNAYDEIKQLRENSGSYQSQTNIYNQIINFINLRAYSQALQLLQSIQQRTAQWYYYSSYCYYHMGYIKEAQQLVTLGIQLYPNDLSLNQLLQQLVPRRNYRPLKPQSNFFKYLYWFYIIQLILNVLFRAFAY